MVYTNLCAFCKVFVFNEKHLIYPITLCIKNLTPYIISNYIIIIIIIILFLYIFCIPVTFLPDFFFEKEKYKLHKKYKNRPNSILHNKLTNTKTLQNLHKFV